MINPFDVIEARLNNIETLLLDLKHKPKEQGEQPDKDELLTVQETAKFLSLSVATIYSLTSRAELTFMKRSKRLYFSKLELINYLKQGKRKTRLEITNEAEQYLINKKRVKLCKNII